MAERTGCAVLMIADTGEIQEIDYDGTENGERWEQTSLDIALRMVPHLMDAIDRCRIRGEDVCVSVKVFHIDGVCLACDMGDPKVKNNDGPSA